MEVMFTWVIVDTSLQIRISHTSWKKIWIRGYKKNPNWWTYLFPILSSKIRQERLILGTTVSINTTIKILSLSSSFLKTIHLLWTINSRSRLTSIMNRIRSWRLQMITWTCSKWLQATSQWSKISSSIKVKISSMKHSQLTISYSSTTRNNIK